MAFAAQLLRPGGQLVFITPRSYAAGPYFRLFREVFFGLMEPERLHLFGSRREAFDRDEVLQENVILKARRLSKMGNGASAAVVQVSFSQGVTDLASAPLRLVPLSEVIDRTTRDRVLHIPTTTSDDEAAQAVRRWSGTLHRYGMEISTGPVVAFRATEWLAEKAQRNGSYAPLLWMQHVKPMQINWPIAKFAKPQYIEVERESLPLLLPNRHYVVLRRFSAKEQHRRLTAAPLPADLLNTELVGLENHLNYIHRPGGTLLPEEVWGLAALLNSSLLDIYFRIFSGNTQVSATELRAMPLPPLDVIHAIGRRAMEPLSDIEQIATELLGTPEAVDEKGLQASLLAPPASSCCRRPATSTCSRLATI
jgi:adenine-specific DNA-methyltransferase